MSGSQEGLDARIASLMVKLRQGAGMLSWSKKIRKTKLVREVHMKTVQESRVQGSTGCRKRLSCVKVTAGETQGGKKA